MKAKIFALTVLGLLTLITLAGSQVPLPAPQTNSPPRIIKAKILPDPAYTNTDLQVEVEAEDAEDDFIRYTYQWVRVRENLASDQGEELDGETSATLSHEKFIRGDVLAARITSSDWNSEGVIFQTHNVVIANSPPEIISSPPETFSQEGLYSYQVQVTDPDNDQITFSLSEDAPEGMTIDPETGLLTWRMSPGIVGTYKIQIHGNDGHQGTCFQNFTLTLEPEEIVPGEGH